MAGIVVHTSEPSSGAARYVSELVKGLAANNACVTLFCPPGFDYLHEARSCGARVAVSAHRRIGQGGLPARVAGNVRFLIGTAKRQLSETHRGDVVHVQFPLYFPAGLMFFLLARLRGCAIVFTAHDPVPHKWLFPRGLRWLEWMSLRQAYSLSDRLIVHNETGRRTLTEKFRQDPGKIAVIPHGPLTACQRIEAAPPEGLRLLVFGSIRENKGVHLAIEAVQRLNTGETSPRVRLTIAGELANAREQNYWKSCTELISRNPAGISVINRYIEDHETGPLLAEHHALLLPYSEFLSESGVAALALANQRPIIATRAGGLGPMLASCNCGIAIEEANVDAVTQAVAKALEAGPQCLREMGETGARFMESSRSWNEIGRRTIAVYDDLRGACVAGPRILMLITTLTFGGAETQVVRLAVELKRRGWLVKVVCMVNPSAYVSQLTDEQIEVDSLRMPRGVPDPRALWRLRRIVNAFRPDIVHCHMVHANLLGRVARLFCRIPALICTAHNLQERSEKGGATWHKELLYRVTDFLADRTTIICRAAFDRYVKVHAVPARKLELIPNGIDMQRFSPSPEVREATREKLGIAGRFVWLAVGRLVEQKNYSGLFEALTMLPGDDWRVLIAGNGPLAEPLQEECRRLGLTDRVTFLGAGEDIWQLYNAADALVMSSHYEGLSIALLEAASMGLPGVVTDVGGNAEVVVDGVTGWVVEPGSPRELAGAMRRMQDAPAATRRSFGDAARAHCQQTFRFESVIERWIALYSRYLSNAQSA